VVEARILLLSLWGVSRLKYFAIASDGKTYKNINKSGKLKRERRRY
jgi:hypothetical protein